MNRPILNVGVFCGSQPGIRPEYSQAAYALGVALAQRSIGLIYGGASIGLMGMVADGCLSAGGHVLGILPDVLVDYEIAHEGLASLTITGSMHERKAAMYQGADAFIVLPGGIGTLEELFEVVTWAQIGIHAKPIALLNVAGFFDPLMHYLDHASSEGFITPAFSTFARVYTQDAIPHMLADLPAIPGLP
jgi:cytokinin riboside 5'-monophosphate phosphoribohydrolase